MENNVTKGSVALQTAFDENGHRASPILPPGVKNYLIDIDGTICDDVPNEEPERMVTVGYYPDALEVLNRWYDEGHIIIFSPVARRRTGRSQKNG
jgi:hypothetical protein